MIREQELAKNIVIIDGMSGSGKSLLAPVITSLERAEMWQFSPVIENMCILDSLGEIDHDAAKAMIRLECDMALYNSYISRNTNFRPSDDSGTQNNRTDVKHKLRLLRKDGDEIVGRISAENPIMTFMVHYIFPASSVLFDALGERLKLYIIMTRNRDELVSNWVKGGWSYRYNADPRDWQPCVKVEDSVVPWFTKEWANEYHKLSPKEQAIKVIDRFNEATKYAYSSLHIYYGKKLMFIPFEDYSKHPDKYIDEICKRLDTKREDTEGMMRQFSLPRTEFPQYHELSGEV